MRELVPATLRPASQAIRSPMPGCPPHLRYRYARDVGVWLLNLPSHLLIGFAFLLLDAHARWAGRHITQPAAHDLAGWGHGGPLDWLRPPPTLRPFERQLLERYLGLILAPEWTPEELLERAVLTLGRLLDTPLPPAGITLYPLADGRLGSALAGDLREPLAFEMELPERLLAALHAGVASRTTEPRAAAWLPLRHEGRFVGCIEVRDPGCIARAVTPRIHGLLAMVACALAHTPLTDTVDDLPARA